jgi:rare lipoprotein A
MRCTTALLPLLLAALLAGCASRAPQSPAPTLPSPATRPPGGWPDKDGPDAVIPPDLHRVPDALPKLENIRRGGPNKPYEVLGQRYEPMTEDRPLQERGLASWYGRKFHGRPTASGEVYNMYAMSAAHPTMPLPSYARVRNPRNGREVIVRVNDRGPFHRGRIIDLSYTAALKLDLLRGVAPVELERITYEDIRTGAWLRDGEPAPADTAVAALAEPPPVFAPAEASGAPQRETTPGAEAMAAAQPVATPQTRAKIASGFWLQLGAFRQLAGAEGLRAQLSAEAAELAPLLTVVRDAALHRLQAGPYASRAEAAAAAERLRSERGLTALVVERR